MKVRSERITAEKAELKRKREEQVRVLAFLLPTEYIKRFEEAKTQILYEKPYLTMTFSRPANAEIAQYLIRERIMMNLKKEGKV